MFHNFAKRVTVVFCFVLPVAVSAQRSNRENSPYSRFGVGEAANGINTTMRGIGYSSTAYGDELSINSDNPASYSWLRGTTYELGLQAATRGIQTDDQKYNTGSASLAYMAIGIPLKTKRVKSAFSLGLRPQTKVFYHNIDSTITPNIGKSVAEYSGEGGLNFAYIGGSVAYKGFSLGANIGYLFGTIRNSSSLVNIDTANILSSEFSRFTQIGGIYWKGGAQYETKLNKKLTLRLGATATISQGMNLDRDEYSLARRVKAGTLTVTDTTHTVSNISGRMTLPLSYSFGAQIGNKNWRATVDYSNTAWSQYRSFGLTDSLVANAARFSAGIEYTPDPMSVYNYLSRVTYRLGFYTGTDNVLLRNTEIKYYAVTAGASLPFRREVQNRVHISGEYGSRGTLTNSLIKENFFKLTLGISLIPGPRDEWFKKKYN